ncbi:hypothetical protein BJY52DRAFT_1225070 [Lactarius psammicola]|nr:hypothetical protein BJY52DRAFT_1225070 [Lactarius psammicola]
MSPPPRMSLHLLKAHPRHVPRLVPTLQQVAHVDGTPGGEQRSRYLDAENPAQATGLPVSVRDSEPGANEGSLMSHGSHPVNNSFNPWIPIICPLRAQQDGTINALAVQHDGLRHSRGGLERALDCRLWRAYSSPQDLRTFIWNFTWGIRKFYCRADRRRWVQLEQPWRRGQSQPPVRQGHDVNCQYLTPNIYYGTGSALEIYDPCINWLSCEYGTRVYGERARPIRVAWPARLLLFPSGDCFIQDSSGLVFVRFLPAFLASCVTTLRSPLVSPEVAANGGIGSRARRTEEGRIRRVGGEIGDGRP